MTLFCRIHEFSISYDQEVPEGVVVRCPICSHAELMKMRDECWKAREEKKKLLDAIEIKMESLWEVQPSSKP